MGGKWSDRCWWGYAKATAVSRHALMPPSTVKVGGNSREDDVESRL